MAGAGGAPSASGQGTIASEPVANEGMNPAGVSKRTPRQSASTVASSRRICGLNRRKRVTQRPIAVPSPLVTSLEKSRLKRRGDAAAEAGGPIIEGDRSPKVVNELLQQAAAETRNRRHGHRWAAAFLPGEPQCAVFHRPLHADAAFGA